MDILLIVAIILLSISNIILMLAYNKIYNRFREADLIVRTFIQRIQEGEDSDGDQ